MFSKRLPAERPFHEMTSHHEYLYDWLHVHDTTIWNRNYDVSIMELQLAPAWVEGKVLWYILVLTTYVVGTLLQFRTHLCLVYRPVHSCRGYHIYTTLDCFIRGSVSLTLVNIEWRVCPDLKTTLIFNDQLYNHIINIIAMYSLFSSLLSLYVINKDLIRQFIFSCGTCVYVRPMYRYRNLAHLLEEVHDLCAAWSCLLPAYYQYYIIIHLLFHYTHLVHMHKDCLLTLQLVANVWIITF